MAVDTRKVSAASDTVGVREIHVTSECIPTVVPEFVQTRPRDSCCMDLLPPVGESIESLDVDALDAMASGMEAAGGSSKVGSDMCVGPDVLQTAVYVTTVVSEKVDGKVCLKPRCFMFGCLSVRRRSCLRKFGCRQ